MKVRCECNCEMSDVNGLGCSEVRGYRSKGDVTICSNT